MPDCRGIIALDLDGTLLNSNKQLSPTNFAALERAAKSGWEIVPTTGRFYGGMPEFIRKLPFVHYAITINGAYVEDLQTGAVIYRADIPWQQAVEIMTAMDELPVIYDCYMDNAAFMTEAMKARADEIISSPHYRKMVRELRKPVPELKAFIAEKQQGIQKVQLFTNQKEVRAHLLENLEKEFADLSVSSSISDNVEINQIRANKGEALLALAEHLGLPREQTVAFGDGLNDLSMIEMAGLGIAMANAEASIKDVADAVTLSCDEDGVAYGLQHYLKGR